LESILKASASACLRGEGIGTKRRSDNRAHLAQDAVVVDPADLVERLVEFG
jgi:hypothetical protein